MVAREGFEVMENEGVRRVAVSSIVVWLGFGIVTQSDN